MDSLPLALAAGALALSAAGFLLTRAARRRVDPGDFERRLEEMRKGQGLSGSRGALIGHTPRPAPEPPAHADLPTRSPVPTLESFTAPPPPPSMFSDPLLGEFSYNRGDEVWEQEDEDGPVRWLYLVAGPEGPTDVQRRCLAEFKENDARILERAIDRVGAMVRSRGLDAAGIEPESLWVEAVTPHDAHARGCVYFSVAGRQGLPANAATSDDWATLQCDLDSSLEDTD